MFIYIDESGTFTLAPKVGSWNTVAAYVVPEADRKNVREVLRKLKLDSGHAYTDEIKLKDISEQQVIQLLHDLNKYNSTLYISGIDLGSQNREAIVEHQRIQVEKIRSNIPKMVYEEGRALVDDLAARVERLSLQLYTQMVAQIDLLDQVYRSTTLFYAQRIPATLGAFRWLIDEKNPDRPLFEETMRHLAPAFMQSKSLREPGIFVEGFDYSHYERAFGYKGGEIPKYLEEETGVEIRSASNLGKLLSDISFVRSHDFPGVQLADLLASTFRRALRGEFEDNHGIARLLGNLSVQRPKYQPPIHLITLSEEEAASGNAREIAEVARSTARSMLM